MSAFLPGIQAGCASTCHIGALVALFRDPREDDWPFKLHWLAWRHRQPKPRLYHSLAATSNSHLANVSFYPRRLGVQEGAPVKKGGRASKLAAPEVLRISACTSSTRSGRGGMGSTRTRSTPHAIDPSSSLLMGLRAPGSVTARSGGCLGKSRARAELLREDRRLRLVRCR